MKALLQQSVSVHSFAWVWCIIKMLVELWVYAIGLGCGVTVVHTDHTGCDEYLVCRIIISNTVSSITSMHYMVVRKIDLTLVPL